MKWIWIGCCQNQLHLKTQFANYNCHSSRLGLDFGEVHLDKTVLLGEYPVLLTRWGGYENKSIVNFILERGKYNSHAS